MFIIELIDILKARKSIRKYEPEPIANEDIKGIIKAGLLAPSGRNKRPIRLVVVENRDMLKKLSSAKQSGSDMLAEAGAAIVVIGDEEKSDTWIEDGSLVMGNMMLAATERKIGSCWVQCRGRISKNADLNSEEYIKSILNIDEKYRILAVLALGTISQTYKNDRDLDSEITQIEFIK